MDFQLQEDADQFFTETLKKNPLRWAGDSIKQIKELVEAGSHEPNHVKGVDPDRVVFRNREFLANHIETFKKFKLTPPADIQKAIDLANEFLKNATFSPEDDEG